jgi:cysteine desulfurase/selenocysteine lyase
LELSKYPETGAPFDLSGAGPLIAALGLPKADIPNLGGVNEASAESRFLPSWLTGEATLPPWGIDWAQAAGEAPPNPGPGLGVMERPSLEVLGLEVHEPLGYRGYPGYQGYQGDGAAPDGAKPKAEKGTPGASGLDLAHGFQNLPTLAPPPYVGHISVGRIREDFPILQRTVEGGQPLIWFDNAATTQKPRQVIDRLVRFYQEENSNVHRGAHTLANKATEAYEEARRKVAAFIGAGGPENVVFVRGTTEGINLVAHAFVAPKLTPGDEIILTELEHHANIVPWQIVASQKGAYIKVLPIDDRGQLILSKLPGLVSPRTKVIALAHVSNALGTVTEIPEVIALAKSQGIPVVIDAAQSVAHLPLDVKALGADFLVFSGHKIYGPTGIGVVYGTSEALNQSQPWQGGGNMISDVTFERTLYREPPVKFEAGTPNIAGAVGLAAALDYVGALGIDRICLYEEALLHYLTDRLRTVPGLTLIGTAAKRAGVVSFVLANRSVADVGTHLARYGIALRAGHHCAQPAVRRFGLEGTVRPAPAFYNTPAEVDRFVEILGLLV